VRFQYETSKQLGPLRHFRVRGLVRGRVFVATSIVGVGQVGEVGERRCTSSMAALGSPMLRWRGYRGGRKRGEVVACCRFGGRGRIGQK
jgi:hypothetical protein